MQNKRRGIFIMAFICICSTLAISQNNYLLTGAPATEFNGIYVEDGIENGKPYYLKGVLEGYTVSGATESEFNGDYAKAGTENGKPYYLKGSTYKIFFRVFGGPGEWDISKASGDGWQREYMLWQDSPTATPPQTGWTDHFGVAVASLNAAEKSKYKIFFRDFGGRGEWDITRASGDEMDPWVRKYMLSQDSPTATPPLTGWTDNFGVAVASLNFVQGSVPTVNLKMWLRADHLVTASGLAVSAWGDISGNSNNASQSTAAYQPSLVSSAINSKPVVRFNGTSSYMNLPTPISLGVRASPYEFFIVARSSVNTVQFLLAGANEQYEFHLSSTNSARFIPVTNVYIDETAASCDGNPHLFSGRASATGGAIRIDGVDGGTSSADIRSSDASSLRLGRRADNGYPLNGDIAEVLLYNNVLTTSARDSVERYIAQRYAITSGSLLPVELFSFTASAAANGVTLNWKTATETNNYGFEIQKISHPEQPRATPLGGAEGASKGIPTPSPKNGSVAQCDWVSIGFVEGNGTTSAPKSYSYTDKSANGKALYRLKQIDRDGKFEYSKIVEVTAVSTPKEFGLEQNYPNPFNPTTAIGYQLSANSFTTLKIYDAIGREVATLVSEVKEAGLYSVQFDGAQLSSGIYFAKLTSDNKTQIRKLLLMK